LPVCLVGGGKFEELLGLAGELGDAGCSRSLKVSRSAVAKQPVVDRGKIVVARFRDAPAEEFEAETRRGGSAWRSSSVVN